MSSETDSKRLTLLISILGLFSAIFLAIIRYSLYMRDNPSSDLPFQLILIFSSSFFLVSYLCTIISAIFYHTFYHNDTDLERNKKLIAKKELTYAKVVNYWPFIFLGIVLSFLFPSVYLISHNFWVSLIITLILILYYLILLFVIVLNPYLPKKGIISNLSYLWDRDRERMDCRDVVWEFIKSILKALITLFLLFLIFTLTPISVEQDNDFYGLNSTPAISVKPINFPAPIIESIFYYNETLFVNTEKTRAPAYVTIPSPILQINPGKSYITINYFFFEIPFIGKVGGTVKTFVPIFKDKK